LKNFFALLGTKTRVLASVWLIVTCILCAHVGQRWIIQGVMPDTDILALLPEQKRDPILQESFTHMVDSAQQKLLILVGTSDWEQTKKAAQAYVQVMQTRPDVVQLTRLDGQAQSDWLAPFLQHRSGLLTKQQERALEHESAQYWSEQAQQKIYSAFSGPKLTSFQEDPFDLFSSWVQERAQETPVRPRDGFLYVGDDKKNYILLAYELKLPAFSMAAQSSLTPLLEQAKQALHTRVANVELIQAGMVLHAAAASAQAEFEVSTIGIGSLLGIILLTFLSFRSLKPILFILLSIGVGFLGALSLSSLLFDRIHMLTLVFGASLIGVAQDYSIYFLCNRIGADEQIDSASLLKRLMPGLLLTLLTTMIGYLGLALTPFPGLQQMAVFSGLGLVFAWLTVVCWFPVLLPPHSLKRGLLVRSYSKSFSFWPRLQKNWISYLLAGLLLFVLALAAWRLSFNDDIRSLQTPPKHLLQDQIKLGQLLDAPSPVQYFLVRANSAEEVLQKEELLKEKLDGLVSTNQIAGYQAISNWVPSQKTQAYRQKLIEQKLLAEGAALSHLAAQLGEDEPWQTSMRSQLLKAQSSLTLERFFQSTASSPWRHLWLGNVHNQFASIVAIRGLKPAALPAMQSAASGMLGVQWVDKVAEISQVLGLYRVNMTWVLCAAYFVVLLLLFPRYRWNAWRALMPTALASLLTLALFSLTGQSLQLFHVLAFMLLLGVGVDYGIFMQESHVKSSDLSWLATSLSAVSTLLSFGLLALSRTPALHAFGLTMLIGTLLVWLIVPFFSACAEPNQLD
jgi:predicted exporter